MYRHPNHAVTEFICELDKVLTNVSSHNTPCLIAGDINVDLTKCKVNNHTAEYINNLLTHNFMPTILMPPRITSRSSTLIDHILYYSEGCNNKKGVNIQSGNFVNDLTDHLPSNTILLKKIPESKARPKIYVYLVRKIEKGLKRP